MNRISQEARKKQAIVKYSLKNGKSKAAEQYGVSLSSVKRWCKHYDGTWESLKELPHTPHSHPKRHTPAEERKIKRRLRSALKDIQLWLGHSDIATTSNIYTHLDFDSKISSANAILSIFNED